MFTSILLNVVRIYKHSWHKWNGIIAQSAALFEHFHVPIYIHMHSHAHTYTCTHTLHTCYFSLQCVHFLPLSSAGESPEGSPSVWDRGLGANFCWGRRRVSWGWQKHFSFCQANILTYYIPSKIGSAFNTQLSKVAIYILAGIFAYPGYLGHLMAQLLHMPCLTSS